MRFYYILFVDCPLISADNIFFYLCQQIYTTRCVVRCRCSSICEQQKKKSWEKFCLYSLSLITSFLIFCTFTSPQHYFVNLFNLPIHLMKNPSPFELFLSSLNYPKRSFFQSNFLGSVDRRSFAKFWSKHLDIGQLTHMVQPIPFTHE